MQQASSGLRHDAVCSSHFSFFSRASTVLLMCFASVNGRARPRLPQVKTSKKPCEKRHQFPHRRATMIS